METDAGTGAAALIYLIIVFAVGVLVLAGMWLTFRKADKPGWAAIIPILCFGDAKYVGPAAA